MNEAVKTKREEQLETYCDGLRHALRHLLEQVRDPEIDDEMREAVAITHLVLTATEMK